MVRKLFKYEFAAFSKPMLPMYILLGVIAVLNRGVQLFETESTAYAIVFWSSLVALFVAVIVCFVMTAVTGVTRFYRNLFTAEGYLSFTLPVTPAQHLLVKGVTALAAVVATTLACLLAGAVAAAGEPLAEALKAVGWLCGRAWDFARWQTVWFGLEGLLAACLAVLYFFTLVYACVCVGQLAKKRRVLAAFGVFLGWYFVCQIVLTVLLINAGVIFGGPLARGLTDLFETNPVAAAHIAVWLLLLLEAVMVFVYSLVSVLVMRRRLNLE